MPLKLIEKPATNSKPVHLVTKASFAALDLDGHARAWADSHGFKGQEGKLLTLPGSDGRPSGVLYGMPGDNDGFSSLATGALARQLPAGGWHFADMPAQPELAALGVALGAYSFDRYRNRESEEISFAVPGNVAVDAVSRRADAIFLVRDLINTPTNDMGPAALEEAVRRLAGTFGAKVDVVLGDELLGANLPMIHAVGRAGADAPRLIDLTWGAEDAPKVTLVGKGVCFDTGGLDIKPASGMLLMKKDMGGAANVLGLASMIMSARMNVRLRVLIPAVENSIAGNAFRPGDVLTSRKGLTVEIGNTDAEGRLVLADALALGDEEQPQMMIDMATLTGAARVALGPDLPPFFTDDEALASEISQAASETADPLWRLPLWGPYDRKLSSRIADLNNVTTDGFAGSVTAALFLRRFVEKTTLWAHFDVFGWNPVERPHCPIGGEAQGIRALEQVIAHRFAR